MVTKEFQWTEHFAFVRSATTILPAILQRPNSHSLAQNGSTICSAICRRVFPVYTVFVVEQRILILVTRAQNLETGADYLKNSNKIERDYFGILVVLCFLFMFL